MNASGKTMEKVLSILERRSVKALEQARKELLFMNVQSLKARQALRYYAENWNDITHPGILSLACEAVGGDPETIIPVQVAMLLIDAAIDVHDDILDHSKTKDGKLTILGKYGEKIALLLGDAMLIRGLVLLNNSIEHFSRKIAKNVLSVLEKHMFEIGNAHLREIEFMDVSDTSPLRYFHILEKKGSTIGMHTRIGAMIGRGTNKQVESLGRYGEMLGTLIAIREEFIDIFEPDELKIRLTSKYPPLPILYASNNRRVKEIIASLSTRLENDKNLIEKLVEAIFEDYKVKKLIKKMQTISEEALKQIEQLKLEKNLEHQLKIILQGTIEDLK